MEEKRITGVWIVAAMLLLLVPSGVYVGAYFALCREEFQFGVVLYRIYDRSWQATAFKPAAALDSKIRGNQVLPTSEAWATR